jgi:signal peptidase I
VPRYVRHLTLLVLGGVGVLLTRCRRVEVTGASMAPTLLDGDRLLVCPTRRLRVGALVVLPDPRKPERTLVKRVAAVPDGSTRVGELILQAGPEEVIVLGDQPAASTDSRTLGPVPAHSIVGTPFYRYHPPERAGRL